MATETTLDSTNLQSPFRLDGRVVLVTGAAGHLGRAMTLAIAAAGAHVIANGRSPEKLQKLVADCTAIGLNVEPMAFDVTSPADIEAAAQSIARAHGALDGIVNNAYGAASRAATPGIDEFVSAATINTAAPYMIVEACREMLRQSAQRRPGGASIVNIASMYGVVSPDPRIYKDSRALANPPHYGASKAGMIQLSRYLACHLAPERIRVNSIVAGAFPSPQVLERFPLFEEAICAKIPAGRIGTPQEIAGPVVFLLSDAASYVSGAAIHVDGALTAW